MVRSAKEKTLGADLPAELVNKFQTQTTQRGIKKRRALEGAVRLWLSLPSELKVFIISGDAGDDVFMGLLDYIKNDKIGKFREILMELLKKRMERNEGRTSCRQP